MKRERAESKPFYQSIDRLSVKNFTGAQGLTVTVQDLLKTMLSVGRKHDQRKD